MAPSPPLLLLLLVLTGLGWCAGGGPVPEAGLAPVLRDERVHRLRLRRRERRVPHHAPECDWLLEHQCDPAGALQLDGAGLSGFEQ